MTNASDPSDASDACADELKGNALSLGAALWGPQTQQWSDGDVAPANVYAPGTHAFKIAGGTDKSQDASMTSRMKANAYCLYDAAN